jgi:cell division protein FtsI/penicillin-binding protein 2
MDFHLQKGSRSRILAGLLLAIAAIFIVRLFYLQIIKYGYYKDLADQEQVKQLTIPAQRGMIYALDGTTPVPLVMNQTVYTVFADPTVVDDQQKVIDTLHDIAGGQTKANIANLLKVKNSRYQIIATDVSLSQTTKIKAVGLHGIGFQANSQRVYPEGGLAAQVLGFVNTDGVANYGVEQEMDQQLKGTDGLLKSVTDVADVPLTIGNQNIDKPAQNGENVVLSIDRNVQSKVEQALADGVKKDGATNGSVIVLNPQNGRVLAMANVPTYNPADYGRVTDAADFNNDVISHPYEPGSDIKTFTMATGVDKNVVHATDTYNNTGSINVAGTIINNAEGDKEFGNINFQTALEYSLNTGFVTVAERLGDGSNINLNARNTMYDYFHNKFQLGQLTGIPLAGEAAGQLISPDDPSGQGNAVRYSNMAFGQGMDVTMLQVASGFDAIVNGGTYYKPSIVAGSVDQDGTFTKTNPNGGTRILQQSTSDEVRQMIVTGRQTVFPGIDKAGYQVGGKTGTSQVAVNGGYASDETVGTYLGFGGGDSAQYVIMVEVSADHKIMQGAQNAMPIFTDISNWLLDYLQVQPKS